MPRYAVFIKTDPQVESGDVTEETKEGIKKIMEYNFTTAGAGKLIWADGLTPAKEESARVTFKSSGESTVAKIPQTSGKVVSGYWIINTSDLQEATKLVQNAPLAHDSIEVDIRKIADITDYPDAPEEARQASDALRAQMGKNAQALSK